jgi:gamma-glutamyl-gamma-aminobutyrate hydrolase PuuD
MTYPIIGVITYQGKNDTDLPIVSLLLAFINALAQAGGMPVLIPSNPTYRTYRTLFGRLDGILFTGSGDKTPNRFRSETSPCVNGMDAERDSIKFSLLETLV